MTLAKLFTFWQMQGIRMQYKELYYLEGQTVMTATVNMDNAISANIIYRGDVRNGKNKVCGMISADMYFTLDKTLFIKGANLGELEDHIS